MKLGSRASLLLAALVVAVPFTLLLGLVEAQWEPLIDLDQGITAALYGVATGHPVVVTVMQAVSDLGSSVTWWVLHSVSTLYLLVRRLPASRSSWSSPPPVVGCSTWPSRPSWPVAGRTWRSRCRTHPGSLSQVGTPWAARSG
ncbi:hypothetical protein [Blastococcus brunescens]|uniref:Uncharacterized protein n=1 Tax=Blastococcus brunescens TaxID=1564165 RepID=A0ABZ1B9V2_9ACTN|nr:hypothetical protein [Blastococcus sp. BMG 8361]WRL65905.1 hypothetical protein U6N30_10335 [Blastococcus sp. BMG 8361]